MPRLIIKRGPGVGRDHALGSGECVVGRDPAATFVLEDQLVSRRHFVIEPQDGTWYVKDLGSTNGTHVNGQKVDRVPLADGDAIQVGATLLSFVQKDILGARPAKPAQPATPPKPEAPEPPPGWKKPPVVVRKRRHLK